LIEMRLRDQVILITGSTTGIGAAMARLGAEATRNAGIEGLPQAENDSSVTTSRTSRASAPGRPFQPM